MKKLIVFLSLVLATSALADDGWKWKPSGTKAITPVGSRTAISVGVNTYDATAGETLPISVLRGGTIYNGDATGTGNIVVKNCPECE